MDRLHFDQLIGPTHEWVVTAFQEWQKDSTGFDGRVSAGWGKEIRGIFFRAFPEDFKGAYNYARNGGDCYLLLERQANRGTLIGQTQGCYLELEGKLRNGRPNPGYFRITAGYGGLCSAVQEIEKDPHQLDKLLLEVCSWGSRQPEHANLFASMGRLYVSTPDDARRYLFTPRVPLY